MEQHTASCLAAAGCERSAYACVPHATVLPACNSQRHHALGALTECLAPPHCWVLGPPIPSADRCPFTTLRQRTSRHAVTRKARRRDGSVASRSAPVMLPARLFAGAGRPINIPGRRASSSAFRKNRIMICANPVKNFPRHSGTRQPNSGLPEFGHYQCPSRLQPTWMRGPGSHTPGVSLIWCDDSKATNAACHREHRAYDSGLARFARAPE